MTFFYSAILLSASGERPISGPSFTLLGQERRGSGYLVGNGQVRRSRQRLHDQAIWAGMQWSITFSGLPSSGNNQIVFQINLITNYVWDYFILVLSVIFTSLINITKSVSQPTSGRLAFSNIVLSSLADRRNVLARRLSLRLFLIDPFLRIP